MKSENFKRLAAKRLDTIVDQLRVFGNLSNRGSYDYTQEQIDLIFTKLRDAIDLTEAGFRPKGAKANKATAAPAPKPAPVEEDTSFVPDFLKKGK